MILRVVLAAILAGLVAGLAMAVIQHVRLTPMITYAETFEHEAHGHGAAVTADKSTAAHSHGDHEWKPSAGFERAFYSAVTAILAAIGFSLILTGISFFTAIPITPQNGLMWGLCGFLAFSFAPAMGLAPELPGMAAADVTSRQIWWLGTAIATAMGLWMLAKNLGWQHNLTAVVFLLLPHLGLAPKAMESHSPVPAALAAQFVANSLGANLVMWAVIGFGLGLTLKQFAAQDKS